jgi:hypothetical protein
MLKLFRFEDLVGRDQLAWMAKLLQHCDIQIPQNKLEAILSRLSFERLSGGRKPGEESKTHKYRSGKHGDWMKYFDDDVLVTFNETAGNLPELWGYAESAAYPSKS